MLDLVKETSVFHRSLCPMDGVFEEGYTPFTKGVFSRGVHRSPGVKPTPLHAMDHPREDAMTGARPLENSPLPASPVENDISASSPNRNTPYLKQRTFGGFLSLEIGKPP